MKQFFKELGYGLVTLGTLCLLILIATFIHNTYWNTVDVGVALVPIFGLSVITLVMPVFALYGLGRLVVLLKERK